MTNPRYDSLYDAFDSPLNRDIRAAAYGEDIGQHSWLTAGELRGDIARLGLDSSARLLDLGCGPCGPLTFVAHTVGCRVTGLDVSEAAIDVGRRRAQEGGVDHLTTICQADLNLPLPLEDHSMDAALSVDVVIHLRDRGGLFKELSRVLVPGGKLLFTDAGVLGGPVTSQEIARRSFYGFTQIVPSGFNERELAAAGFRVLATEDRTDSVLAVATARLEARLAQRDALEAHEGGHELDRQNRYLETLILLSRRRGLTRIMYLAESHGH